MAPRSTSSTRWIGSGAALGLLLALVTQAPAHWLTQALEQASHHRLSLEDPQGTVWQGSAQWALREAPLNATNSSALGSNHTSALRSRVTWDIGPRIDWGHMRLMLSASVASACCTPQPVRLDVSPIWRGVRIQVSDHTSRWPANWLVGLGAPWNTVQPEGQMQVQTQQLTWLQTAQSSQVSGQAELQMQQLATRLSTLRPLGSYRVRLQGGEPVSLTLDTLEGSLQLSGQGQLEHGQVRFTGEATAAPDAEAALSNLLNILGQRQGAKSILKMG